MAFGGKQIRSDRALPLVVRRSAADVILVHTGISRNDSDGKFDRISGKEVPDLVKWN